MSFATYLKKRISLLPWLVLGGVAMTLVVCTSCRSSPRYFFSVSALTIFCWALMWFGNEYLHEYLDEKIDWTKHPVKRIIVGLIVMTVYTVPTIYIVMRLTELFSDLNLGAISKTIYMSVGITLVITTLLTSRSFLFKWRQNAIDAEKFKRESAVAKFESLRSQVNPHFLFNSLNALTNLVYEDQDKAAKFIKRLSEVYRYLLDTRDKEIVPLEEEEKFLSSYLFLQQIRFGKKLKLTVSLDKKESMVPPLVLQMLVENAIKHNIISEQSPLTIDIYTDADFIVVENNLQLKKEMIEASPGVGLENIRKRYEFLTDKKIEVIENQKFVVRLPLIFQT
ncbi:MAG TPA: histidine kinase [Chryseolinea sp.]